VKRTAGRGRRGTPTRSAPARPRAFVSLKVSDAFKAFVLDQLETLGDVVPRAMFGGIGLYRRGFFFGIVARDTLYLKVGDRNRRDYERAGTKPFKPYAHRAGSMQYYAVPLSILENADDLARWARESIAVAQGE
jgi:DNA transformation protein and related proteins